MPATAAGRLDAGRAVDAPPVGRAGYDFVAGRAVLAGAGADAAGTCEGVEVMASAACAEWR
jgi:hypothetical protein